MNEEENYGVLAALAWLYLNRCGQMKQNIADVFNALEYAKTRTIVKCLEEFLGSVDEAVHIKKLMHENDFQDAPSEKNRNSNDCSTIMVIDYFPSIYSCYTQLKSNICLAFKSVDR